MAHAQCETCGNTYEKAFHVSLDGQTHVFDSFECAIEALAPRCTHCQLPRDRPRHREARLDLLLRGCAESKTDPRR